MVHRYLAIKIWCSAKNELIFKCMPSRSIIKLHWNLFHQMSKTHPGWFFCFTAVVLEGGRRREDLMGEVFITIFSIYIKKSSYIKVCQQMVYRIHMSVHHYRGISLKSLKFSVFSSSTSRHHVLQRVAWTTLRPRNLEKN